MSLGGSFMPLGTQVHALPQECPPPPLMCACLPPMYARPRAHLCPMGLKCTPPLKSACTPLCVCTLGLILCPLGAHLCPLGLIYVPWGCCVRTPLRHARPLLACATSLPTRARPLWQPCAPPTEPCTLQVMQYNGSLHPTIQRGSDMAVTVDKVIPVLPCQRSTWLDPYRTDMSLIRWTIGRVGRMDTQTTLRLWCERQKYQ
jgi:hypothetical protein